MGRFLGQGPKKRPEIECPRCGAPNDAARKFCRACGKSLAAPPPRPGVPIPPFPGAVPSPSAGTKVARITEAAGEYRVHYPDGAPHCDQRMLHAPGDCVVCDYYPDRQALRVMWGIAFTGRPEDGMFPCPFDVTRGTSSWPGNQAKPADETVEREFQEYREKLIDELKEER